MFWVQKIIIFIFCVFKVLQCMFPSFGTPLTQRAYAVWSFQREKHWWHGIFVIVNFYQDSESLADASHFHRGSSSRFQNEAETSLAQLSCLVIKVIFFNSANKNLICLVLMQSFSCAFVLFFCWAHATGWYPNIVPSSAYIQVHFRHDFFIEANNMNPNQIDPFLIWSHVVCNITYQRTN